jgi:hypothetical protein
VEELDAWKHRVLELLHRIYPLVGINSFSSKKWMQSNFLANRKVVVALDQIVDGALVGAPRRRGVSR